jgi:hypothetical protein
VLFTLTGGKASPLRRDEGRRPACELSGESIQGRVPNPRLAAEMLEGCRRLLELLDDPLLQVIAVWRLAGFTEKEVGDRLGYSQCSIKRKVALIRRMWGKADDA